MKQKALNIIVYQLVITLLLLNIGTLNAFGQEKIHAAVAANYILPFQEIATRFEAKSGIHVEAAFSSTGQIYAQIKSGAPYDLFLSADEERPDLLHKEGLAAAPFTYATGQVVLWTRNKASISADDWRKAVAMPGVRKIAIANPKTAPYGAAAMKALEKAGLKAVVEGKLVFAQNIAQSFQFTSTGGTDAGFCALSSALSEEGKKGYYLPIDNAPLIVQSGCMLNRTKHKGATEKLIRFLSTPEAVAIKKKYGYQ